MSEEKNRRMELRKETGTRTISPPKPPSYLRGTPYAMSFACFNCRKSFKRHFDVPPCDYPNQTACSECGQPSYNLGRNFKTPKKSDHEQWEKVEYLVNHGFVFQKIRPNPSDSESVPYPKTLKEAKVFVIKYKRYAQKL